jgi:hypothetical protein
VVPSQRTSVVVVVSGDPNPRRIVQVQNASVDARRDAPRAFMEPPEFEKRVRRVQTSESNVIDQAVEA